MADDIVEHLAPIDILENHVVMVLMDDHLAHPAYVRVIQKHRQSCFAKGSDLLGCISRGLTCCRVVGCARPVCLRRWVGVYSRQNFHGQL